MNTPVVSTDVASAVGFEAGGRRWRVPALSVREIHADLALQPVPLTADWFLGNALPRGRLVAVSDFSAWLGSPLPVRRYVEFERGFALGVASVVSLALDDGSADSRLIDPDALLMTDAFVNIRGRGGSAELVPNHA